MKVWLIHQNIPPYRVKLFQAIAQTPGVDFKVVLLSAKFKTRPYWQCSLSELPFRVDTTYGLVLQTSPTHEYCFNPFMVLKLLRERPDVVVCNGFTLATVLMWLGSYITRTKYVIWSEATLLSDGSMSRLRLLQRRLLARRASAFVDAGTLAREYVRYLWPNVAANQLYRAYNGVDNKLFMSAGRQDRNACGQRGLPAKNLLFVGRLNDDKGVPQLLKVYHHIVAQSQEELGLILIGEGELQGEVKRFGEQHGLRHLHMTGWLKNEETACWYALSSAFVLLTKIDRNPLVIFEALAASVPIVCSNKAGNALDFIKDGVNGYIVDPLNTDEIVARVLDVLSWDEGRRGACEQFSRESVRKANYQDAAAAFVAACRHALKAGLDPS